MRVRIARFFGLAVLLPATLPLFAQQPAGSTGQPLSSVWNAKEPGISLSEGMLRARLLKSAEESAMPEKDALSAVSVDSAGKGADSKANPPQDKPHKFGALSVFGSWRFRTEAWDWFQPATGENAYAFSHSLLRVGISQKRESFEWLLEGAQDAISGLPGNAVVPGRQGQLGLGGSYFVANGGGQSNVNGFVKQAYVGLKLPANGKLRLGRFTFSDGAEVAPQDKTVATLINTRIAQRLIGDFGFSAVQRSFDGVQLAFDAGKTNLTLFGARPTRGVYQVDAMGEVAVDVFYGAYTIPTSFKSGAGEVRVFALGYVDERGNVLKTDNRPLAGRTADRNQIRIGTYGADYVHVSRTADHGQFDFLLWGAVQNGSWGVQSHRAGAFVGEFGWQPPIRVLNPWFSAGYSFGSGDSNSSDNRHATFFQVLPTPRAYARFPFYNMENNEDFYGTAVFRFAHSLAVRSEVHALRLANAQDLWYGGGGAFQPRTFGYTGRASGGNRSLANIWDVSLDAPLRYGFSITTYFAHAWGKSVVSSIYPAGNQSPFGYVETNFRF